VLDPRASSALDQSVIDAFSLGGRFEYDVSANSESSPFPWNWSGQSLRDRTRLMLELRAPGTKYGELYLKGVGVWSNTSDDDFRKRFWFRQGDYLWKQELDRWQYAVRLFANERRFWIGDMIAPVLYDDLAGKEPENRGIRLDARVGNPLEVTALYSVFARRLGSERRISYLWGLYSTRYATLTASYLFKDPGNTGLRNQAVFKTEISSSYKQAFLVLAYQQSGYSEGGGLFFPSGSWHWGDTGGSLSDVLPDGAAFTGELRLTSLRLRDAGRVRIVYRYGAYRQDFINTLGTTRGSEVVQTAGAYFMANKVSVNGRLVYHNGARFTFQNQNSEWIETALWGHLNTGGDFLIHGGIGDIEDALYFDTKKNFVHLAVHHQAKRIRAGAHIMWKDLDTIYSAREFAFDGKLALSPNWGVHWRLIVGGSFDVRQSVLARLEYRPNDRIFLTADYGRAFVGDDRFMLQDPDIDLFEVGDNVYSISVRGDF
jgi:hypothetical protein